MGSQLLICGGDEPAARQVDDIRARAAFQRRMGNVYTLEDMIEDVREVSVDADNRIAIECGLRDNQRKAGTMCDEKVMGEDCHACQAHAAGLALDCGIGESGREAREVCKWGEAEDCGECRVYAERLKRDCQMPTADRVAGRGCLAPDVNKCAACAEYADTVRHEREVSTLEAKIVALGDVSSIAAELETERDARARAEAALEREQDARGAVERWARQYETDLASARANAAEDANELAVVRRERNDFFLQLQRLPSAPVVDIATRRKAPDVLRGQRSLFDATIAGVTPPEPVAAAQAPAAEVVPMAPGLRAGCTGGCGAKGRHRSGCALAAAVRWTKVEIKAMTGAIDSTLYTMGGPEPRDGFRDQFTALLATQRTEVVREGIGMLRGIAAEREKKDADAAVHFRVHPEVYGDSTPEMIERFTGLAEEARKDVARADALLAKIEASGLPAEVVGYDPFSKARP